MILIGVCGSLISLYLDIFVPMWYGIALFMLTAFIVFSFSIFSKILFILGYSENDRVVLRTLTCLKFIYKCIPIIIIVGIIQGIVRIITL